MLTPVETFEGVHFKRDYYFKPYGEYHVNGGKVRQLIEMFNMLNDKIKNEHNGGIITAGSVHSPQSANVACVAKQYGYKCN